MDFATMPLALVIIITMVLIMIIHIIVVLKMNGFYWLLAHTPPNE